MEIAEHDKLKNVHLWTTEDVAEWLIKKQFNTYVNLFTVDHKIDGQVLLLITEDDLRLPPLAIPILGDIKRLLICLGELKSSCSVNLSENHVTNGNVFHGFTRTSSNQAIFDRNEDFFCHTYKVQNSQGLLAKSKRFDEQQISQTLKPEFTKLIISYLYMFMVLMLTSFIMVIVNDRVPDMDKYPPLPDIMLDNLPYIPWAFEACEATAIILSLILLVVLIFHKHRFIILRRMFAMTGTVFMIRCITMLITSLSVPGTHLQCQPKTPGSFSSKIDRAMVIWWGCGMSLRGVRTCGDYMFSGHTVILTLLNFFITEYTPRKIPMLHTMSWLMNIFAVFFILAGHEHYSIDVFVAFYITSRLFLYYHSLANNLVLRQPDCIRTRIWFPLFSYFESSINGIVPNEFELPWARIFNNKKKLA